VAIGCRAIGTTCFLVAASTKPVLWANRIGEDELVKSGGGELAKKGGVKELANIGGVEIANKGGEVELAKRSGPSFSADNVNGANKEHTTAELTINLINMIFLLVMSDEQSCRLTGIIMLSLFRVLRYSRHHYRLPYFLVVTGKQQVVRPHVNIVT